MRRRTLLTMLGAAMVTAVVIPTSGAASTPAAPTTHQTSITLPTQIPFLGHGLISKNNEISKPHRSRPGAAPVGWVLVIHGGGWQVVGPSAVAMEDPTVRFLHSLGWATDNVDYRKGEHSLPDVLAAYDELRAKVGSRSPVCVLGQSAGGNLGLLVAEYRRSVTCVISEAGPTDLVHLAKQDAFTPSPLLPATTGPSWIYDTFVVPSFGTNPSVLRKWSPVHSAGAIRAPLLLGASTYDDMVPQQQMTELRSAMRKREARGTIKTVLLAGTPTPHGQTANFTHASITKKALTSWKRDERRLLSRVASAV